LPILPTDLPPEASDAFDRIMARVEVEGSRAPRAIAEPSSWKTRKVRKSDSPDLFSADDSASFGRVEEIVIDRATHTHNTPLGPYLPGLLGPETLNLYLDCLYRAGDKLIGAGGKIEEHLRSSVLSVLDAKRTVLLYDLTNTHFEGLCESNPLACRGKNKQKRNDCPQIVVGMVFDEHGFVVSHRVFAGNQSDSRSLPEMIRAMREAISSDGTLPFADTTVILDGGLASKANLVHLKGSGFHYIVHDKRPLRKNWSEEFDDSGFTAIPDRDNDEEVLVRTVGIPPEEPGDQPETALLCRSAGRREKEKAILSMAETRLLEDLRKLEARARKSRKMTVDGLGQAVGRIRERRVRAARYYEITVSESPKPAVSWKRKDDLADQADDLLGCYVLRTDRTDLGPEALWRLYMTLNTAEDGFRTLKSDLSLRPMFHQLEDRVRAHVLITVVAYQLTRYVMFKLRQAGDRRSWSTLRRILSTHCYATMIFPRPDGSAIRIRRPGVPDAVQKEIYSSIGIDGLRGLPVNKTVTPARNPDVSEKT
jgi:transposase